ncbi:hypothetical protein N0V87_006146 [Didymella glomerata]|uniref:Uncharacterized protein n=1 Tax=Didymella glomerata TaxID=749621 RepID=A0A9W8WXJ6_9PLEO|nr:hypothetical protein N0V87_006146 [Didymella glomerata]
MLYQESGTITFRNNIKSQHDLIVGADGIGSVTRKIIDLNPGKQPVESSCLHTNVWTKDVRKLGLVDHSLNSALEYWEG